MSVSICVPGVLKDKADLQRGWGVEPRGPDVSAKERLRRFYYVYNRSKVGCFTALSRILHASCRKYVAGKALRVGKCPRFFCPRGVPGWFPDELRVLASKSIRRAPPIAAASSVLVYRVLLLFRCVRCSRNDGSKVGDVEDILVAYDGKESKLCKGLVERCRIKTSFFWETRPSQPALYQPEGVQIGNLE